MDSASELEEELAFKVRYVERCWAGGRDMSQEDLAQVPGKRMEAHLQACLNEVKRRRKEEKSHKPTVLLRLSNSQITMCGEVENEVTFHAVVSHSCLCCSQLFFYFCLF